MDAVVEQVLIPLVLFGVFFLGLVGAAEGVLRVAARLQGRPHESPFNW